MPVRKPSLPSLLRNLTKTCVMTMVFSSAVIAHAVATASFGISPQDNEISITLSEEALSAIDNGVSLTFISEFAVPKQWGFLNWKTQKETHRFVISKHALSDRYHLYENGSPTPKIFRSSSMSVIQVAKVIKRHFIDYSEGKPSLVLRVYLSKTELPAPLRMTAFASSQWDYDSGWGQWISTN